jgi:hypothetical protein
MLWNGSAFGLAWTGQDEYAPGGILRWVDFQATDATGAPLGPVLGLCSDESETACVPTVGAAWPGGWGFVHYSHLEGGHFVAVSGDGASTSAHVPLGRGPVAGGWDEPDCMAWTGADFAVLITTKSDAAEPEHRVVFVSSEGIVGASARVAMTFEPFDDELGACVWASSRLNVLVRYAAGDIVLRFYSIARDGSVVRAEPIHSRLTGAWYWWGARLVWTGSEFGAFWLESRDSGPQVYFMRLDADGVPVSGEVQLTPASSASATSALMVSSPDENQRPFSDEFDPSVRSGTPPSFRQGRGDARRSASASTSAQIPSSTAMPCCRCSSRVRNALCPG